MQNKTFFPPPFSASPPAPAFLWLERISLVIRCRDGISSSPRHRPPFALHSLQLAPPSSGEDVGDHLPSPHTTSSSTSGGTRGLASLFALRSSLVRASPPWVVLAAVRFAPRSVPEMVRLLIGPRPPFFARLATPALFSFERRQTALGRTGVQGRRQMYRRFLCPFSNHF